MQGQDGWSKDGWMDGWKDGRIDGWMDGWMADGVCSCLRSPSASASETPVGVHVTAPRPDKGIQQSCSSAPRLTRTGVPSPKRYYLLESKGRGVFSKTVVAPRGAAFVAAPNYLLVGVTRPPWAILDTDSQTLTSQGTSWCP